MRESAYNVLFLCTANSARSILAEAILNRLGGSRFRAFSAGSRPKGEIHPLALALLDRLGHDTSAVRSKSWEEFADPGAPVMDFIFTVCDNAAGEACPVWPGRPATAHWGVPDPADAGAADGCAAFDAAYRRLCDRIAAFVALPMDELEADVLHARLKEIGRMFDSAS